MQVRSRPVIHGHPDGADPVRRDQTTPDGLDRHSGPDAQRDVCDTAQQAFDRDVGTAAAA